MRKNTSTSPARNTSAARTRKGAAGRATAGVVLASAAVLAFPAAASAHVSVDASTTAVGEYATLTFAIGHGCEGSPTESVTVDFPAEIGSVKPTAKPGWDIEVSEESGPRSVTYTAAEPLPDELRDTIEIAALLPLDGEAGDVLTFPVAQECTEGGNVWDQVADGGTEPELPAPQLTLTAAEDEAAVANPGASASAEPDAADEPAADAQARAIGTGGLIVGTLGVALAIVALRRRR
ncbi:YcnI family copper-binding membrane protein [Zhihengliuella salsuginis]|uniref:YncI copper-binding domain-containing protein n=1 Tax=Zhihengliuella salsuginis TaxID=578222 RepID=A0ABQ3GI12_9MICC|nr:YcnI family protein [Zhihengliuella salsuginis]GHD05179.1 hypothetical protein GCM10008096_13740 [Zhihengliuella salsuginis]